MTRRSLARQLLRGSLERSGSHGASLASGRRSAREALDASPLDFAVGRETVRRYEAGLVRLRPRDREAVLGRIELHWSYGELAEALGVTSADAARAVVTRALSRLVEAMGE
jgi:RNA polymerase sigma-70 factor (ECF subfamily)